MTDGVFLVGLGLVLGLIIALVLVGRFGRRRSFFGRLFGPRFFGRGGFNRGRTARRLTRGRRR